MMFVRIAPWKIINMDKVSIIEKPMENDSWYITLDNGETVELDKSFEDDFFCALEEAE